jgi:cyclopropane-fatty-acyl-phospholipid synthase
MGLFIRAARRAVESRLALIEHGRVELREAGRSRAWGRGQAGCVIEVRDARFFEAVAFGGAVGAGEAFAAGWWTSPDLVSVVRTLVRNREALDGLETGSARILGNARRLWHTLRANSRGGARRNIRSHYDLGNDFFAVLLDETMTYSCALFDRPDTPLAEASIAKYDRIAALLDLQPDDHLVEIGSGWGGFAMHAASRYGCRVTTTTISAAQHALAQERIAAAGLTDRITLLRDDYRDLRGTFDKLVSIEMIEAIGHEQYASFYRQCAALLAPHGRAVIQAITIADERYEQARREVDFIKRYIFPGSNIPSRTVLAQAAAGTDLTPVGADEIGLHYAETLRRWRHTMRERCDDIAALGFDDTFMRLWEFYFCYCEGGFLEQAIGAAQLTYAKPAAGARLVSAPPVPSAPAERAA